MILYLDILLAVNWVIDFLLLHATARLLHVPRRGWRVVIAAAVGAVSCCAVLFPPWPVWLSVGYKAAVAFGMAALAFGWRRLWQRAAVLFLTSTAVAGMALAVWWLLAPAGLAVVNGVVYVDVPPLLLIGCTAAAYGLFCLYARYTAHRAPKGHAFQLIVTHWGRTVRLPAFYDSGHHLTEPFSGAPVVVVSYEAVQDLLPPEWKGTTWPCGARWIPFTSVGGSGALPAFCPTAMYLEQEGTVRNIGGTFVAVSDQLVEGRALLGTALMCGEQIPIKKG